MVGVDREACALYKKELDCLLPKEYSAVVYTSKHNDEPLLAQYRLREDEEKRVRKAFTKPGEKPKILIVTEKLLTGFDAPILYCMYLDKPMRDHVLLQAVARVNRPYENAGILKPAGLIIDFIGIFERMEKALSFDSDVVEGVIKNLDILKDLFARMMKEEALPYLKLCRGRTDDKSVERAMSELGEPAKRDKFFDFFKRLQNLYEIISPDPMMRPFMEDYANLCRLYQVIRAALNPRRGLYADIMKKTEGIVRECAQADGFGAILPAVSIDEAALEALKKKRAPAAVKIINLVKTLVDLAQARGEKQPFLIPIGERAEAILKNYEERILATEEALKELEALLKEYEDGSRQAEKTGLSAEAFAVFCVLKRIEASQADVLAQKTEAVFKRLPHFADNAEEMRRLKAELYNILRPAVGIERMKETAEQIIKLRAK